MRQKFYLIYRTSTVEDIGTTVIDWFNPTGALVGGPELADQQLVSDVAHLRYHCAPYEKLTIAEVWEETEVLMAKVLHQAWEKEQREHIELMEVT